MRSDVDPDYEMMRAARMQSLRLIDLPRLAAHRRIVAEGEAAYEESIAEAARETE